MSDKQKVFTKWLYVIGLILCVAIVVVHVISIKGTQMVIDVINAEPERFPDNFGLEIGLGLSITLIYMWIFHALFILFLIPTAIIKNISLKKDRVIVADIVLSCLLVLSSIPSFIYGIMCFGTIFKALSYGVGGVLIPFVVLIVVQLAYVVACIVHLFVCKRYKNNKEIIEE